MTWARIVSPPAVWGKLPTHADYVQQGVRDQEVSYWQAWLAGQVRPAGELPDDQAPHPGIPVIFALPPRALGFAPHHWVSGVAAASCDKLGRAHPIIVYQQSDARWLRQQFERLSHDPAAPQSHGWHHWLARAVARYSPSMIEKKPAAEVPGVSLTTLVRQLWDMHSPGMWQYIGLRRRAPNAHAVKSLLDEASKSGLADDPAADLASVARLPWSDWPECIWSDRSGQRNPADCLFWQQDGNGGYVAAARRLGELWGR